MKNRVLIYLSAVIIMGCSSHINPAFSPLAGKNYFDKEGKLIWGLKCCNNMKCKPPKTETNIVRIHNRDINATLNMLKIIRELIKNGERPKIFKRKVNK